MTTPPPPPQPDAASAEALAALAELTSDTFADEIDKLPGDDVATSVQFGAARIDRHFAPLRARLATLEAENARLQADLARSNEERERLKWKHEALETSVKVWNGLCVEVAGILGIKDSIVPFDETLKDTAQVYKTGFLLYKKTQSQLIAQLTTDLDDARRKLAVAEKDKAGAVEMWDRTVGELQKAGDAITDLRQRLAAAERERDEAKADKERLLAALVRADEIICTAKCAEDISILEDRYIMATADVRHLIDAARTGGTA